MLYKNNDFWTINNDFWTCYTQLRWMNSIELRLFDYKSKWAIAPQSASYLFLSELLVSRMVNRGAIGTCRSY